MFEMITSWCMENASVGDKSGSREIGYEAMAEVQITRVEVEECCGEEVVDSR